MNVTGSPVKVNRPKAISATTVMTTTDCRMRRMMNASKGWASFDPKRDDDFVTRCDDAQSAPERQMRRACGWPRAPRSAAGLRPRSGLLARGKRRPWLGHCVGLQDRIEFFLRQQLLRQHQVVDALPGRQRLLGDLGGVGVADVGIERGDDSDRMLDRGAQPLAVGRDALDA